MQSGQFELYNLLFLTILCHKCKLLMYVCYPMCMRFPKTGVVLTTWCHIVCVFVCMHVYMFEWVHCVCACVMCVYVPVCAYVLLVYGCVCLCACGYSPSLSTPYNDGLRCISPSDQITIARYLAS